MKPKAGKQRQDRAIVHGGYSQIWEKAISGQMDRRTRIFRAMNSLRNQLVRDLGGEPLTQERILVDRAVVEVFRLQALEIAMLDGKNEAESFYISLSNSLRLDLLALGLQRRAKDATKTLKELLDEDRNSD